MKDQVRDFKNTDSHDKKVEKSLQRADEYFKKLDELEKAKRLKFNDYIKDKYQMPTIERAEAWLQYIAENLEYWGDQESVVYFLSRGKLKDKDLVHEIVEIWKQGELESYEKCAAGISVTDSETGETTIHGQKTIDEVKNILGYSPFSLPNFWHGHRYQEDHIDATMLRVYEWTEIGGFDEWFARLLHTIKDEVFGGGISAVPGCYYLFYLCRSNFAIDQMAKTLEFCLEAIKVQETPEKKPWQVFTQRPNDKGVLFPKNVPYPLVAAVIVFASHRLYESNKIPDKALITDANNAILKYQNPEGGWKIWEDYETASVEVTAICLHALSLSRPKGWNWAVEKGKKWIESQQTKDGYWIDKGTSDPINLTVLVLDALEIADGGVKTTLGRVSHTAYISDTNSKRFKVSFSFPGEIRNRVFNMAEGLSSILGKEYVFYDDYYKAHLARPDLDTYLQNIYYKESELIVVLIGQEYEDKRWCNLEWRAIKNLITERGDDIMLLRYDDADISGLFPNDGYIDINKHSDSELIEFILERIHK